MAKTDSNTIIDASQDPALSGVNKSTSKITINTGPLPDNTYVDKTTQIINNPGGNVNEVQINAGGTFAGDNGFTFNRTTDQLSVKGNLNVGGYIKGKIITNRFNFFITGGANGQVLATDGTGNLRWVDQTGGGSGTNYSNANVASYLPTFTGNLAGGNLNISTGIYTYDLSSTGTAYLTTLNVNAQSRLGSVGNVKITGGSANYVLKTDGAGNLSWTAPQSGPQGPQGPQGNPGAAGTAATITVGTVTTGAAGTNVIITNTGNASAATFNFTIPKGDHGDTGPQGDPGPQGDSGPQGDPGAAGATGPKGDKGDTGAQGIPGSTGAQGAPGSKGDKGDTGEQGVSVTLIGSVPTPADLPTPGGTGEGYIVSQTGNLWFWNSLTTTWNDIGQIVGPQGDQGPQGDPGGQGAQGDQGPAGNDGIDGVSFVWQSAWNGGSYVANDVVEYQGSTYICTVNNNDTLPTDTSFWQLMSAKGDQGANGSQGEIGPRGYGVSPGGTTGQVLIKSSDADYDTIWQDLSDTIIHISDNPPNSAVDGTVWWSSQAGRSYIKYDDQWVDMSPQTLQPDTGNPFDQDLNTSDNVTFNDITADNVTFNDLDVTTGYVGNANIENLAIGNSLSINNLTTGNVTANYFIGDGGLLSNLPTPTFDNTILINDIAPNSALDGTLWFNSQQGRTFVKYDDQWVDSSPQTIDPTALRPDEDDNVEFPNDAIFVNGRIYQDASEGTTSMRWVNMEDTDQNLEMLRAFRTPRGANEGDERGQLGLAYQSANVSGLYIKSFNNEDEKTWTFEGTGNLRFPDDTIQTTAYQPATLLDGGGANSTYISNFQPGSIPNPFDQELNTNDIVQFANVTAGYFIGDGSQLTGIPTSNANTANVTFSNQTVIGTGDIYGGGGLYLAQGPASVANLQYFRIRGGDNPTHIHFDTADNDTYDQYFGDDNKYLKLELGVSGNVVVGTNNNTYNWKFGIDGNLTLPTNTSAINYANGSPLTAAVSNVTTDNFRINGEERGLIVDAGDLKRFGFMKYAGIEGSLVHSAYTGAEVPLRIGRTSTADVTAANVNTFTTEIYVGTNGCVRIGDDTVNNINDPTNRLEVNGNIKTSTSIIFNDNTVQTTAYRPTTAPTTSKGSAGNKAGMVAYTNGYFYYCITDYTDGVADIWVRSAWDQTSWS